MPFTRSDMNWAHCRVRIEQSDEEAARFNIQFPRTQGFLREAIVDASWGYEGPARVRLRFDRQSQIDPTASFIDVHASKPTQFRRVDVIEAEHTSDDELVLLVWPLLEAIVPSGDIAEPPPVPPLAFEADVFVRRVA
ncbi:MAG: hypothetical protein SFX73_00765 [Kofleriaceae bacterium]|nr:hypothetical protein [Kofleriaceae bacterium]